MSESEVKCKICGEPTQFENTIMCNGCWELSTRIEGAPETARQILREYDDRVRKEAMCKVGVQYDLPAEAKCPTCGGKYVPHPGHEPVDPLSGLAVCIPCMEEMLNSSYLHELDDWDTTELLSRVKTTLDSDKTSLRRVAAFLAARGKIEFEDLL